MFLLHALKLVWSNIVVGNRELLHGVLDVTLLNLVNLAVGSFTNEIYNLEAPDKLLFRGKALGNLAHLLKVVTDLSQGLKRRLSIELLEQGDVGLKVPVEIANVNKVAKNLRREHQFEAFSVLLDRKKEAQCPQAVELNLRGLLQIHLLA